MLGAVSFGITLISIIVRTDVLKLLRIPIETVCGDLMNIVLVCFLQSKRKAPHVDAFVFLVCDLVVSMPKPLDIFLGTFVEVWGATVCFVMSLCMEQLSSNWTDIFEI
jgi:hypothetical protein